MERRQDTGTTVASLAGRAKFTVTKDGLERAATELAAQGVTLEGPMTHDWIPARSLYFADPDGHDLEFLATL